jgi:hypothetical protein
MRLVYFKRLEIRFTMNLTSVRRAAVQNKPIQCVFKTETVCSKQVYVNIWLSSMSCHKPVFLCRKPLLVDSKRRSVWFTHKILVDPSVDSLYNWTQNFKPHPALLWGSAGLTNTHKDDTPLPRAHESWTPLAAKTHQMQRQLCTVSVRDLQMAQDRGGYLKNKRRKNKPQ